MTERRGSEAKEAKRGHSPLVPGALPGVAGRRPEPQDPVSPAALTPTAWRPQEQERPGPIPAADEVEAVDEEAADIEAVMETAVPITPDVAPPERETAESTPIEADEQYGPPASPEAAAEKETEAMMATTPQAPPIAVPEAVTASGSRCLAEFAVFEAVALATIGVVGAGVAALLLPGTTVTTAVTVLWVVAAVAAGTGLAAATVIFFRCWRSRGKQTRA